MLTIAELIETSGLFSLDQVFPSKSEVDFVWCVFWGNVQKNHNFISALLNKKFDFTC